MFPRFSIKQNPLSNRKQRVLLNGKSSEWQEVTSGVPQGSVLGPVLFLIYVNLIDDCLSKKEGSFLSKFADDTKLVRTIDTQEDSEELQSELNNLVQWSNTWTMSFNTSKCKVMHLGRKNPRHNYTINGHTLEETQVEKDVGVMVNRTLKPSDMCAYSAKKANQMLGILRRSFKYRDTIIWPRLYQTFVRPKLEFSAPAWKPWTKKDIRTLERVQKRAVNCITSLRNMTYKEKLRELGWTTLEQRRNRGDAIAIYKIVKGLDDTGTQRYFEFVDTNGARSQTRQNSDRLNLKFQSFNTEIRHHSFSCRAARIWNKIPPHIKDSRTLDEFKARFDQHMRDIEDTELAEAQGLMFSHLVDL